MKDVKRRIRRIRTRDPMISSSTLKNWTTDRSCRIDGKSLVFMYCMCLLMYMYLALTLRVQFYANEGKEGETLTPNPN